MSREAFLQTPTITKVKEKYKPSKNCKLGAPKFKIAITQTNKATAKENKSNRPIAKRKIKKNLKHKQCVHLRNNRRDGYILGQILTAPIIKV